MSHDPETMAAAIKGELETLKEGFISSTERKSNFAKEEDIELSLARITKIKEVLSFFDASVYSLCYDGCEMDKEYVAFRESIISLVAKEASFLSSLK